MKIKSQNDKPFSLEDKERTDGCFQDVHVKQALINIMEIHNERSKNGRRLVPDDFIKVFGKSLMPKQIEVTSNNTTFQETYNWLYSGDRNEST